MKQGLTSALLFIVVVLIPQITTAAEGTICDAEPTSMSVAYGDVITCSFESAGDTDTFRFAGTTGESVFMQATDRSGSHPCLQLIAPDASSQTDCENWPTNAIDTVLTQTGTYSVIVYDFWSGATGEYTLTLERLQPPSSDGVPIVYGQTSGGVLDLVGDLDLFTFSGSTADTVRLYAADVSGTHPCLQMIAPDNSRAVACENWPSNQLDQTLTQTGTYSVLLSDFWNAAGSYNLTLTCLAGPCACLYSIDPNTATVAKDGGTGSVAVTTTSGCAWNVVENETWLHCTSGCSGTESGTVGYSVDPNPSNDPRSGTMTIAGKTFTVNQNGACLYCDYFEDGILPIWTFIKGNWSETAGYLSSTPVRKAIAISPTAFMGCSGCTVRAGMRTAGGIGNRVWLLGWYADKGNTIELMMKQESGKWVIKQRVGGVIVKKAKGSAPIVAGTDYTAEVSLDGNTFKVLIDGSSLITMPKATGSTPSGAVGFQVKGTTGSFDFIEVR